MKHVNSSLWTAFLLKKLLLYGCPPLLAVYCFPRHFCLFVSRITQKVRGEFSWHFENLRPCIDHGPGTTTTTTVLRPFVRDYPDEPVLEETFTHPPPWSSSNLYQLLPSITIHSILHVQITCFAIFLHNLYPCPLRSTLGLESSTSYSIHFFTQSVSSFRSTCPHHRNLFCCSINIIIIYSYSFTQLLTWNSIFYPNITHPSDHSHLCSLKCHLIFSERELTFTFAICYRPSVCRLSVCLSVVCRL